MSKTVALVAIRMASLIVGFAVLGEVIFDAATYFIHGHIAALGLFGSGLSAVMLPFVPFAQAFEIQTIRQEFIARAVIAVCLFGLVCMLPFAVAAVNAGLESIGSVSLSVLPIWYGTIVTIMAVNRYYRSVRRGASNGN